MIEEVILIEDISNAYQLVPSVMSLLNFYETIIILYYASSSSYKSLFNSIFLDEITSFFDYNVYADLLSLSYESIDLVNDYKRVDDYIDLHNIKVSKFYNRKKN